jgi:hypothetical protein
VGIEGVYGKYYIRKKDTGGGDRDPQSKSIQRGDGDQKSKINNLLLFYN